MEDSFNAEFAENAKAGLAEGLNRLSEGVIGAAIEVHRVLGPGLLESAYEHCLAYELVQRGFEVERQKPLPVIYKDTQLDCGYRLDLIVENSVIVEVKSLEQVVPVHKAQLLSYLRLAKSPLGLLINFNVKLLKEGIHRVVNDFPEPRRSQRSQR
ncbi:MAG: GxxExxY protein [Planctomycetota bacterium]|jgi:GxxExxY protein